MRGWWIVLLTTSTASSIVLHGWEYHDNKGKYRWEQDNGAVTIKFDSFLPEALTVCGRVKSLYSRHGDQMYFFETHINNKGNNLMTQPGSTSLSMFSIFGISSSGSDDSR